MLCLFFLFYNIKDINFKYGLGGGLLISELIYKEHIIWEDDIDIYLTFSSKETIELFIYYFSQAYDIMKTDDIKDIKTFNLNNNIETEYSASKFLTDPSHKIFFYFN